MKIYPSKIRISIYFSICFLIIAGIIFSICFKFFTSKWGIWQIIIVSSYVLLTVGLYFITIKTTYYVVSGKYLSFFRWGRELRYFYNDIVYIDETKGDKIATLGFFTKQRKTIYLTLDKSKELYHKIIEKCPKRLTLEQFKQQYPNAQV